MRPRLILVVALLLTTALYWSGLSGPFLFDDTFNLSPVLQWHAGQAPWQSAIFPNASVLLSRPVAMASFALTTWVGGGDTFSFKLGNLIVHLACGLLGWAVLRRALARDARLAPQAELLAALAAAFWLLHPLQVSTVLYAVQRMAQLSTLFTLAAVWCYLAARQQLVEGRYRPAWLNLFLAFPLLVLLGVLSKQNAAIAPALCLVLELAYFSRDDRRGRSVATFFGLFLVLPVLACVALLATAPAKLLGGYANWDFTLWQRLLTQPRALMDYLGMLLVPRGPLMGLYTDDFTVSQGLLSPPSTLLALLALVALSITAIALRKRAPSVFAGWFLFLVAHAVESSFLPLEMYYEHRNYMPSLGVFLALLGMTALVPAHLQTNVLSPRQLGIFAVVGFALVLGVATFGRVLVWQDADGIARQALRHHPDSMRLRFDMSDRALFRGDYEAALAPMRYLAASDDPELRQAGNLSLFAIRCMRKDRDLGREELDRAVAAKVPFLTTYDAQAFMRLSVTSREIGCNNIDAGTVAQYLDRIVDAASGQPENSQPKWLSRSIVAEMHMYAGAWQPALRQAGLAWQGSGHHPNAGALLTSINIRAGNLAAAEVMLAEVIRITPADDRNGQAVIASLREMIAAARVRGR